MSNFSIALRSQAEESDWVIKGYRCESRSPTPPSCIIRVALGNSVQVVPGFESYAVNRAGQLFRVLTRAGGECSPRLLRGHVRPDGYIEVTLRKDQKSHAWLMHRLVAWVYLGDPGPLDVCHWNHKRDDNRVENLYIGTRAENTGQSGREGRYGAWRIGVAPANKKLTDDMRKEIKVKYSTGNYRQVDLAAEYGVSQRSISLVCRA